MQGDTFTGCLLSAAESKGAGDRLSPSSLTQYRVTVGRLFGSSFQVTVGARRLLSVLSLVGAIYRERGRC